MNDSVDLGSSGWKKVVWFGIQENTMKSGVSWRTKIGSDCTFPSSTQTEVKQMNSANGRWRQNKGYDSSHSMLLSSGAHSPLNILDASTLQSLKTG